MAKQSPKIAIIILNWNGFSDTVRCVESLFKSNYPNGCYSIHVVDNGSKEDEAKKLKEHFDSSITIFKSESNRGYCGGNNFAIENLALSDHDFVLVLNNDTIVADDCLDKLVEYAAKKNVILSELRSLTWRIKTKFSRVESAIISGPVQASPLIKM